MHGSESESARLAGIHALDRIQTESPRDYHVQVLTLFGAFVVERTKDMPSRLEAVKQDASVTSVQDPEPPVFGLSYTLMPHHLFARSRIPRTQPVAADVEEVMRRISLRR